MKEFSAIRKDKDDWLFDYWADTNPGSELSKAGAILAHNNPQDIHIGTGLDNVRYSGSVYTRPNAEGALRAVQAHLRAWGWSWRAPAEGQ